MTLSLLKFLNETAVIPPVRDYVSASRLNLWLRCPLAFKRRYIDGIESPPSPNLFVGKVVHDVLEMIYRCAECGTIPPENELPELVEMSWEGMMESTPCRFDDAEKEAKSRNLVLGLVRAYVSATNITDEKPLAIEKKFEAPLIDPLTGEDLGIPLIGILDLVLDEETGPVVIDFKTAASASTSSNCELQHELQLTAYAYLVRTVFGKSESALQIRQLVKTKTPRIIVHQFPPRAEDHFQRFFNIVREYIDALERGQFNYRPSWACAMCEHSGSCVARSAPSNRKEFAR